MHIHDQIRSHILDGLGISDLPYKHMMGATPDSLAQTEWSPGFEKLMRKGLLQGAFRYGLLNAPGKPQWNRVKDAKHRLDLYMQDGNVEHLRDAANMCLLEFEEGVHPKRHYANIQEGYHTERS